MTYDVSNEKFKELVINIKNYFNSEKSNTIFEERNIIKVLEYQGVKYAVKSFKIPHLINKIVYRFFRDSKAKRSYYNSKKLVDLNINTPKPIGYIEFESFLFFKESFYICEYFKYNFEIRAVFKDQAFKNRELILYEFMKFTYNLHNKGVYHVDYSPGNILVKQQNDIYEFYIVDVNRMKFTEFDLDLRLKSIAKLTSNRDDNNMILKYYAEISNIDTELLRGRYSYFLDEQQKYLSNKRKIKNIIGLL
jgi:RIO-like serine/threonine protein kinase